MEHLQLSLAEFKLQLVNVNAEITRLEELEKTYTVEYKSENAGKIIGKLDLKRQVRQMINDVLRKLESTIRHKNGLNLLCSIRNVDTEVVDEVAGLILYAAGKLINEATKKKTSEIAAEMDPLKDTRHALRDIMKAAEVLQETKALEKKTTTVKGPTTGSSMLVSSENPLDITIETTSLQQGTAPSDTNTVVPIIDSNSRKRKILNVVEGSDDERAARDITRTKLSSSTYRQRLISNVVEGETRSIGIFESKIGPFEVPIEEGIFPDIYLSNDGSNVFERTSLRKFKPKKDWLEELSQVNFQPLSISFGFGDKRVTYIRSIFCDDKMATEALRALTYKCKKPRKALTPFWVEYEAPMKPPKPLSAESSLEEGEIQEEDVSEQSQNEEWNPYEEPNLTKSD